MKSCKRGNPRRNPKQRQRSPVSVVQRPERARLTLHETDPITGHEDTLYTLSYECYRGYTIYSTEDGRSCIHGTRDCLKLRGKFVCLPDSDEARRLVRQLRSAGYTSHDSVERSLPEGEYVCLNWREQQRTPTASRSLQRVS